jgi:hypothetical protein
VRRRKQDAKSNHVRAASIVQQIGTRSTRQLALCELCFDAVLVFVLAPVAAFAVWVLEDVAWLALAVLPGFDFDAAEAVLVAVVCAGLAAGVAVAVGADWMIGRAGPGAFGAAATWA